jgi:ABC-type multidrug transport system permease subunit
MPPYTAPLLEIPRQGRVLPAFGLIGWRWISRNPAATIAPILLPFIFLYFLSIVSKGSYFPLEIAGAMMFTTQNIGSWVLGDSANWRIESALQDMFVASPMGKVRYLMGIAVSNLIAALPALAVLAAMLYWVAKPPIEFWPILAGSLGVLWVLFSSIGIAMSSRLTSQREIWPVGNLVFTVIGMLSPLYYPLSILPAGWQLAAHFVPATYAALIVQGALHATPSTPEGLLLDGLLLIASALVGTMIALRAYRWRGR